MKMKLLLAVASLVGLASSREGIMWLNWNEEGKPISLDAADPGFVPIKRAISDKNPNIIMVAEQEVKGGDNPPLATALKTMLEDYKLIGQHKTSGWIAFGVHLSITIAIFAPSALGIKCDFLKGAAGAFLSDYQYLTNLKGGVFASCEVQNEKYLLGSVHLDTKDPDRTLQTSLTKVAKSLDGNAKIRPGADFPSILEVLKKDLSYKGIFLAGDWNFRIEAPDSACNAIGDKEGCEDKLCWWETQEKKCTTAFKKENTKVPVKLAEKLCTPQGREFLQGMSTQLESKALNEWGFQFPRLQTDAFPTYKLNSGWLNAEDDTLPTDDEKTAAKATPELEKKIKNLYGFPQSIQRSKKVQTVRDGSKSTFDIGWLDLLGYWLADGNDWEFDVRSGLVQGSWPQPRKKQTSSRWRSIWGSTETQSIEKSYPDHAPVWGIAHPKNPAESEPGLGSGQETTGDQFSNRFISLKHTFSRARRSLAPEGGQL